PLQQALRIGGEVRHRYAEVFGEVLLRRVCHERHLPRCYSSPSPAFPSSSRLRRFGFFSVASYDEGGAALDASSIAFCCSASCRLRRLNPVRPIAYATLCLNATIRIALGSYTLCQLLGSASSALVGNAPLTLASVHFTPR